MINFIIKKVPYVLSSEKLTFLTQSSDVNYLFIYFKEIIFYITVFISAVHKGVYRFNSVIYCIKMHKLHLGNLKVKLASLKNPIIMLKKVSSKFIHLN